MKIAVLFPGQVGAKSMIKPAGNFRSRVQQQGRNTRFSLLVSFACYNLLLLFFLRCITRLLTAHV
jgi:hypothetical protein